MLGFEDCSAKTVAVSSSELSLTQPWMKQHEQLAPKAWSFYSFDVVPEDYQIVINVAAELDTTCELTCQAAPRSLHLQSNVPSDAVTHVTRVVPVTHNYNSNLIGHSCAGLEAGYFGLFAKYGQPPGWRFGEWDFRPEWDYFSERNEDIEIKFDASQPAWQQGMCRPWPSQCASVCSVSQRMVMRLCEHCAPIRLQP